MEDINHVSARNNSTASTTSTISSSSSSVHEDNGTHTLSSSQRLQRPKMTSRKSSGTIIVPREHPRVELKEGDEVFDEDDARAMSPRRSSQDLEKMSQEARDQLSEYVFLDSFSVYDSSYHPPKHNQLP